MTATDTHWRYLDREDRDAGRSGGFDDREAAEAWLSSSWSSLAGGGVATVVLVEDDDEVYRMSLSGADD
jgi:hypothetical protein